MQPHGTRDSYTKWSNSERERQMPFDITYIWNLIYGTNKHLHRKEIHGLGEETCDCQDGGGVWWTGIVGWIVASYYIWSE